MLGDCVPGGVGAAVNDKLRILAHLTGNLVELTRQDLKRDALYSLLGEVLRETSTAEQTRKAAAFDCMLAEYLHDKQEVTDRCEHAQWLLQERVPMLREREREEVW